MNLRTEIERLDDAVDGWWEGLRGNRAADRLFYGASALGDFSLIWHLLGAAEGLTPGHDLEDAARFSITMGLESALVNGPVKLLFGRVRPTSAAEPRPHHLRQPKTSSFPSGHASAAFTAAVILTTRTRGPATLLVYGLATVVATSRIHVRIHHASDVVAGAILGVALGAGARRAWAVLPAPWGTGQPS